MNDTSPHDHILVTSCPDRPGLVAAVARCIADFNGSIGESHNHTDQQAEWFFMRNEISRSPGFDVGGFKRRFTEIAAELDMSWTLHSAANRDRVAILASHESHCLADLLYRWKSGELDCDIACVIANHENLRDMVEWHGVPFHHVAIAKDDKTSGFESIAQHLAKYETDSVVLARFMQILPPALCAQYAGRVINIHHSFLPAFIGANPYQKAFDRGVKLIGATCHYVTSDLDEGPIIEQDVVRIDHSCGKDDMVRLGRDVERSVLSRGLRYHLQRRVLIHGNKTVVFN
jgi:formyltetrahydrofolate deformylase